MYVRACMCACVFLCACVRGSARARVQMRMKQNAHAHLRLRINILKLQPIINVPLFHSPMTTITLVFRCYCASNSELGCSRIWAL